MEKLMKYLRPGLMVLGLLFALISIIEVIANPEEPALIGLNTAIIGIGICVLVAIIFPVVYTFQHLKDAKVVLGSILALILIFVIAYAISPAEQVTGMVEGTESVISSAGTTKLVGAFLGTLYTVFGIAIVSFFYSEIKTLLK